MFSSSVLIALIAIVGGLTLILVICFIYSAINQQVIAKEENFEKKPKKVGRRVTRKTSKTTSS